MRFLRALRPDSRRLTSLAEAALDSGQRKTLERQNGFNAFLARVGLIFDPALDETVWLQNICEAATRTARVRAAFVAQPDDTGEFHLLASSGPVEQLHQPAFSVHPDNSEHYGYLGLVWHGGQPAFCSDVMREAALQLWWTRLQKEDVRSCAVLPIWRAGKVWAVFGVYDEQDDVFDPVIKTILNDTATVLSRGLKVYDELRSRATQLDHAQVGILLLRDDRIQRANASAAALVGCSSSDMHNASVSSILAGKSQVQQLERAQEQLYKTGQAKLSSIHLPASGGQDVVVDLSAVMLEDQSGLDSVWTMENVTERDEAQRLYRTLINAVSAMLTAEDEAEKCHAVCSSLVDNTLFSTVWLAQPDLTGHMHLRAYAGLGGSAIARLKWSINVEGDALPITVQAWLKKRLVYTNDPETRLFGINGYQKVLDYKWKGILSLPVLRGGQVWSVLTFTTSRSGGFDEQSIILCRRVAELLGQSLDRLDSGLNLKKLRHEEELRVRRDPLTALPNRLALEEYLPKAQERASERGTSLAIGLMDLDGFKAVNDTYGYAAGDKVLAELSQRLWENLRESGYVARLGGDEFVVVFENLDTKMANEQVATALDNLSSVVTEPFAIADGKTAKVGLTMGVVLCPQDGDQPDTLLRQADRAMYKAKQKPDKNDASWHFASALEDALDLEDDAATDMSPIAPYGTKSAELLGRALKAVTRIRESVRSAVIPAIWKKNGGTPFLEHLTQDQHARLIEREVQHLEFLASATTIRKDVLGAAHTLGTMYTLFGVDPVVLVAEQTSYLRLLLAEMENEGIKGDDRYLVQQIVEARYRDDRRMRRLVRLGVHKAYTAFLSAQVAEGTWGKASVEALLALAKLPGIQAAFLFRSNAEGELVAQAMAGPCATVLDEAFLRGDARPVITKSQYGNFIGAQAWRTGALQTCPSIALDANMEPWHTLFADLRIYSAISIPIRRQDGTTALVLTVFGACPNQFETSRMQQFSSGLQEKWEKLWRDRQGMSDERSSLLLERLFSGGLCMFMQPVVDLRTGRLRKVEALARLKDTDGTIVSPAIFLPLLGHDDLDRLFETGLEQGLAWLKSWDENGLSTELSLNLPPSSLSNTSILNIVGNMLKRYNIPPARLTLEVLETQDIDSGKQEAALRDFRAMGVQMAMDDLGAGHSNLMRLSAMAFDSIKVDRGLLHHIRDVPLQIFSVIRSLREMGRDLSSLVVVEGLEDAEVIEAMRHLGCHYGQGFGIARPMPADDFLEWYRVHSEQRLEEKENEIYSDLGALAYMWTATRGKLATGQSNLENGPFMRWLEKLGRDDHDAARWYGLLSTGPVTEEMIHTLREWLVDRVVTS